MTHSAEKETRRITQIEDGTVIDHLDPHVVFQVVKILGIDDAIEETVTIGINLGSKMYGKKGIIKIANRFLTQDDVDKLAIISPNATVNIIRDFTVREKLKVKVPDEIRGFVKCPNKNCVTNIEGWPTLFKVSVNEPLTLFCTYCERYIKRNEIEII